MNPEVEKLERWRIAPLDLPSSAIHDATEFPLDAIPSTLRRFVQEAAWSLPVPVDLIAVPLLVALGAAIGNSRSIRLKGGWTESAALYAVVVADPGSMKSPALRLVMEPIHEKQSELLKATQRENAERLNAATLPKSRKQEDTTALQNVRTWTSDPTVESLASLLAQNERGLLLHRDELAGWVKSMNQYKQGRGADRQFYLSCWSGESGTVDRQGREAMFLTHPFLSVIGCLPPDMLASLNTSDNSDDGFLHRILFSLPSPVPVRLTEFEISSEGRALYEQAISKLYELQPSDSEANVLPLTVEAFKYFKWWHDEHCRASEDAELRAGLRGFYSKYRGYFGRLALIHALASDPACMEVSITSVAAAADLINYFKTHAAKALPYLMRERPTADTRCESEIKRRLAQARWQTKREVQRGSNFLASMFNRHFDALLRSGFTAQREEERVDRRTGKTVRMTTFRAAAQEELDNRCDTNILTC